MKSVQGFLSAFLPLKDDLGGKHVLGKRQKINKNRENPTWQEQRLWRENEHWKKKDDINIGRYEKILNKNILL